jgi:hypothetical protein
MKKDYRKRVRDLLKEADRTDLLKKISCCCSEDIPEDPQERVNQLLAEYPEKLPKKERIIPDEIKNMVF